MVPFDFQPRTRVVFGRGSHRPRSDSSHASSGSGARCSSPIAGVVEAGHVGRRRSRLLEAAGIETAPFHDFGAEPGQRDGRSGRRFAAPLGVDSIVGLGGGSSLDCAKGINFLLTNGGRWPTTAATARPRRRCCR